MFRGQFQHSIDAKGRVSLPARFRDALMADGDPRLVLTPAPFDPCLHLYPLAAWQEYEQKLAELPSLDSRIMRFRRLYISPAMDLELDRAGRLLIPPNLRDKAVLEKEVFWAGMGRFIEVWSKKLWDEATAMTEQDLREFKDSVQELIRV